MRADTLESALAQLGLEGALLQRAAPNWAENLVRFLTHPVVSSLLITIAMLGIIIELRTPGFGIPGGLGITSLGLFLWGQRRINAAEEKLFLGETHAHLGRMVAVVAHELRNPLMIIRGSAERLVKKTDAPEAGYVVEEIDRLNQIVTGYLDFARSGGAADRGERHSCQRR
jgi:membrane-bound ClpP family serine protease